MNTKEVDFCKFLTGHDDETIIELYIKWDKHRDKRSGQFEQQVSDDFGGRYSQSLLKEWDIVGMNHYYVSGEKFLFVAMQKDGKLIKEEGKEDKYFWDRLWHKASQNSR